MLYISIVKDLCYTEYRLIKNYIKKEPILGDVWRHLQVLLWYNTTKNNNPIWAINSNELNSI